MAPLIFALLAGVLPALFWLWFWLKEDAAKPEPKGLIGEVFLAGCLAVLPAYVLERFLGAGQPLLQNGSLITLSILALWALIEEGLKLLTAYWFALRTRYYDEPVDAMIYLVTAALGFAAVENTLFIINALASQGAGGLDYLLTGNLRFLGATLVHLTGAAIMGAAIGLTFAARRRAQVGAAILGLAIAVVLHTLFNYFIIRGDNAEILKIFGALWLAGIVVIFLFERVKKVITKPKSLLS